MIDWSFIIGVLVGTVVLSYVRGWMEASREAKADEQEDA